MNSILEDPWISKNTLSKYLADSICRLDKNVRTNVLEVGKTWPGLTLFFNQAGRRGYSSALREKSVSGGEVGLPFSQRARVAAELFIPLQVLSMYHMHAV